MKQAKPAHDSFKSRGVIAHSTPCASSHPIPTRPLHPLPSPSSTAHHAMAEPADARATAPSPPPPASLLGPFFGKVPLVPVPGPPPATTVPPPGPPETLPSLLKTMSLSFLSGSFFSSTSPFSLPSSPMNAQALPSAAGDSPVKRSEAVSSPLPGPPSPSPRKAPTEGKSQQLLMQMITDM